MVTEALKMDESKIFTVPPGTLVALTWEKAYVNGFGTVPWGSSTAVSVFEGVYPDYIVG
jgi:hypothetical protein